MAVSPAFADDHTVFAIADEALYVSTNAGVSWAPVTSSSGLRK